MIKIDRDWLVRELKTKTPKDISHEMGCHVETVRRKIREYNISRSRHSHLINENYFEEWSSNMSYILGFTFADGSINTSLHHNKLCYQIKNKDAEILKFIIKEIQPSRNYYSYSRNNESGSISEYVMVDFSSKKIVQNLIQLGCVPNKTYKDINLPKIPNHFFGDFLRGLFDGDGSINYCDRKGTNLKRVGCSISSNSSNFLEQIRETIGFGSISLHGTPALKFYSKGDIYNFYNIIYSSECFKLERKYDKFKEVFKIWE